MVDLLSIWLHVEACALYPLNSVAFPIPKFKTRMNLNVFELIATSFSNLGSIHMYYRFYQLKSH
jgi:hypothetical protein